AWAAWRLRPRSRSLYDAEGHNERRRILRAARRRRPRPPCGDDPVFWQAIHEGRAVSRVAFIEGWVLGLAWIGIIALGASWFARPGLRGAARGRLRRLPRGVRHARVEPLRAGDRRPPDHAHGRPRARPGTPRIQYRFEAVLGDVRRVPRPRDRRDGRGEREE